MYGPNLPSIDAGGARFQQPLDTVMYSFTSSRSAVSTFCRIGLPALVVMLSAGCAQIQKAAEGAGVKFVATPAGGAASATRATGKPTASGNPVKGTELEDIFKKHPISNSNRPEVWPRVAVTIKSATPGVFNLMGPQTLTPDDCVVYDVRLWTSPTQSKRFDNLRMCAEGMIEVSRGVPVRTLTLMPQFTFHAGQNTTANRRTEGPVPPFHMFPQDIRSATTWAATNQNAIFYLGAILLSMGYDWDNDFDRRLWIVSVPYGLPTAR
jgi:hypothetical protein